MSQAEKDDQIREQRGRYESRLTEIGRSRAVVRATLEKVEVAAAMGDAEAMAAERRAKAEDDTLRGQEDTLSRAIAKLAAEYERGAEARAKENLEALRDQAGEMAGEILDLDRMIMAGLKGVRALLVRRKDIEVSAAEIFNRLSGTRYEIGRPALAAPSQGLGVAAGFDMLEGSLAVVPLFDLELDDARRFATVAPKSPANRRREEAEASARTDAVKRGFGPTPAARIS